ncbi:MAG: hypothetical protein U0903_14305 [Planctomycetales bacterium]
MSEISESARPASARSSFWQRHNTTINFWLDTLLLLLFVAQAGLIGVLHVVFPRGAGPEWSVWGASSVIWSDALFKVFCAFAVGVILHVMLHWNWICGVVSTRFLKRKASRDNGVQTLLGVGLLVVVFHVLALVILVARMGLVGPK